MCHFSGGIKYGSTVEKEKKFVDLYFDTFPICGPKILEMGMYLL
jgi:hypothetical protein